MGDTSISWTDKTWNCVRGCSRVSEGCRNCYAERQAMRFAGPGGAYEGLVTKRLKVANADEPDRGNYVDAHWTGKVVFDVDHLTDPLHWKKPCRVFVNSMSDLFHEALTNDQIAAVFGIMAAATKHSFQVLTKRADRMGQWFAWVEDVAKHCNGVGMTPAAYCFATAQRMVLERDPVFNLDGTPTRPIIKRGDVVDAGLTATWPLPNVWLGVSVENQDAADERIPPLLSTPAAVRFLSCEPLLGPVDLKHVQFRGEIEIDALVGSHGVYRPHAGACNKLDWVIAGAESGPRARPCDADWLRALRDQCAVTYTAFFLKQAAQREGAYTEFVGRPLPQVVGRVGELVPIVAMGEGSKEKGRGMIERPYLDGRQHLEFPA